ncbi:hypothetical protein NH340_JMT06578 [Sarcoptes scabiei]|nr:hypothetical protein NH340_JMT06578 [Sarcoptes scabiei]
MVVICDVKEYRNCIDTFKIPLLSNLFNILHALCNLLIVVPENLKQVSNGDQLVGLDKNVIQSFIQLRADYKSAKLLNYLK